jgi:hypothetical protein
MRVDGAIAPRQLDHHPPPHRALPGPPSSRQRNHPQVLHGLWRFLSNNRRYARKLLIALWRFVTTGEIPQGVVLHTAS